MEGAQAFANAVSHPLDVTSAAIPGAFAAVFSSLSSESCGNHSPVITGGSDGRDDTPVMAKIPDDAPAVAWERRLQFLARGRRLRFHMNSLEMSFSPLHEQLHILASGAATVLALSRAAAQHLQQTLTQRQPVLRALQLLQDRQLLLQERQRLCGLLLEQLRLSSPLLQAITFDKELGLASQDNTLREGKSVLTVCERFFGALEELQRIREEAARLQRVVSPPTFVCTTSIADGISRKEKPGRGSPIYTTTKSLQNSSLRRRALAEAVLQQAGELQELAYQRLYLWLQRQCKAASIADAAANISPSIIVGAQSAVLNRVPLQQGFCGDNGNKFHLPCNVFEEYQGPVSQHKDRNRKSDSSCGGAENAENATATACIASFYSALGTIGLTPFLSVSSQLCWRLAGREEALQNTARLEAAFQEAPATEAAPKGRMRRIATESGRTRLTAPAEDEEVQGRKVCKLFVKQPEAWGHKACTLSVAQEVLQQKPQHFPVVLRACMTLRDRPAYLYHFVQEALQMRRRMVAEEFYRLFHSLTNVTHGRKRLSATANDGEAAAAASVGQEDRDAEDNCSVGAEKGRRACPCSRKGVTKLVCMKRSHPLVFLQGLLHCVTAVAARERAVVSGLRELFMPLTEGFAGVGEEESALLITQDAGVRGVSKGIAVDAAEAVPVVVAAAQRTDARSTALIPSDPQLTDGGYVLEEVLEADRNKDDLGPSGAGLLGGPREFFHTDNRKEERVLCPWQTSAQNGSNTNILTVPYTNAKSPSAVTRGAAANQTPRVGTSAVEELCRSAYVLEGLLEGVVNLFEQEMEEVFSAVQQQATGGGSDAVGERLQQRPLASTLEALLMAHLLDRQAVFLRRLLLFSSSSLAPEGRTVQLQPQQQRWAAGDVEPGTGLVTTGRKTTETTEALETAELRVDATTGVPYPDAVNSFPESGPFSLAEGTNSAGICRRSGEKSRLPSLITCCEAYAEKAELLFLSLWEGQVMTAASSCANGFVANSSSASVLYSSDPSSHSTSGPAYFHDSEGLCFLPVGSAVTHNSPLSGVTDCLQQALEILYAPLSGGPEEQQAVAALSCFLSAVPEDYDGHFVALREDHLRVHTNMERQSGDTSLHQDVSRSSLNTGAVGASTKAEVELAAKSEAGALLSQRMRAENPSLISFLEPTATVCHRAPGRRSKITGLRVTDRLLPLRENESEELGSWVESFVAPLLNFCRHETRHFSDAADAAVFLINAYGCIEAPLRRFRICGVYSQLLEELIEQQLEVLHQVETDALLSRLGLRQTFDAVRREVQRREMEGNPDIATAGAEVAARNGAFGVYAPGEASQDNFFQQSQKAQPYEALAGKWDVSGCLQVGGMLSPSEHILQENALAALFRKFSFTLYSLKNVEMQYIGQLVHEKQQFEARRRVMKDVVAVYAEIYARTRHLSLRMMPTPGEVAVLVAPHYRGAEPTGLSQAV